MKKIQTNIQKRAKKLLSFALLNLMLLSMAPQSFALEEAEYLSVFPFNNDIDAVDFNESVDHAGMPTLSSANSDISLDYTDEFKKAEGLFGGSTHGVLPINTTHALFIGFEQTFEGLNFFFEEQDSNQEFVLEYFNGTSWTRLDENFLSLGKSSPKYIEFDAPSDWQKGFVRGYTGLNTNLYYLRIVNRSNLTLFNAIKMDQIGILNYNYEIPKNLLVSDSNGSAILEPSNFREEDHFAVFDNNNRQALFYFKNELNTLRFAIHSESDPNPDMTITIPGYNIARVSNTLGKTLFTQTEPIPLAEKYILTVTNENEARPQGTLQVTTNNRLSSFPCVNNSGTPETNLRYYCPGESTGWTYNILSDKYIHQLNKSFSARNRFDDSLGVQTTMNITLLYPYKLRVENSGGTGIGTATVKLKSETTGSYSYTCDNLGDGDYGCAVGHPFTNPYAEVSASGYTSQTDIALNTRNAADSAQITKTITLATGGGGGGGGGGGTPDPYKADLTVASIYQDSYDHIFFKLTNQGGKDVPLGEEVKVRVRYNGDTVSHESFERTSSYDREDEWLKAGGTVTFELNHDYDEREDLDIEVCVDTAYNVEESNESNNCENYHIDGSDYENDEDYDLEILDMRFNNNGGLQVKLANTGDKDVSSSKTVTVEVYVDGDLEDEEDYKNNSSSSWLNKNSDSWEEFSNLVDDEEEDEYRIKVCVDTEDNVDEDNESNNCETKDMKFDPDRDYPDDGDDEDEDYEGNAVCGFYDIATHFSREYVCHLKNRGTVQGRYRAYFEPYAEVTRAEFLKMILEDKDEDIDSYTQKSFKDVPRTHWAYEYINYANSIGVMNGYRDGYFRPDSTVTRAEAIVMIMRLYKEELWGYDQDDIAFDDVQKRDWFAYAVILADKYEIVKGYSDGLFRPYAKLTRGETAVIIDRTYENIR